MTLIQPRQMLADTVYEAIEQRLVNHDLEPGAKLNISTLAQELDVSPTPVREALARLEADGLVVKRPNAGYAAAPLMGSKDFDELFEMRLLLEPAAAGRAAARVGEDDLRALTDTLAEMRKVQGGAGSRETLRLFVHQDALFHDIIANSGGNTLMADTLRRFRAHTHLYRLYFREGITDATCREHERVLDALREADADAAAATMRTHLRRAQQRLLPTVIGTGPDDADSRA
ncbi:GntR family transcriptional regulator [Actinoallomurus sp. CA-150999]|uniref:GntR family transcriptional regulator n=1 Tax=Actinoallomurus sp. CA-150999 TaxID=3239887 RepID=UPI003D8A7157